MGIVVQKYGGSSVATTDKIKRVARRVAGKRKQGYDVVVVVSAMGDTTDDLLEKAAEISSRPSPREMDVLLSTGEQISIALLAMALQEIGCPAISMTGQQAGFHTDDHHRSAKVLELKPDRVRKELAEGKVVIVAGFQGIDFNGDITTLGRGGSDQSAIALAAALDAQACQIFTDVDGVYSADPRLVSTARRLEEISYDEILELAAAGAQVMQLRSVEFAKQYGVEFEVLSSLAPLPEEGGVERGTRVVAHLSHANNRIVSGVAVDSKVARLTLMSLPDRPGVASTIFTTLSRAKVNVDMIVQSAGPGGTADISFTVAKDELDLALEVCQELLATFPGSQLSYDTDVAKVSIVGSNMAYNYGVAATMFEALAEKGINVELITGSEIKNSCLVRAQQAVDAVRTVHDKFEAGRNTAHANPINKADVAPLNTGNRVVSGLTLDNKTARVTLMSLPDRPGVAARVFGALGKARVNLDLIVQSTSPGGTADISLTLDRKDLDLALEVCQEVLSAFPGSQVQYDVDVAKVSIVGSGVASNYGVAATMFAALAENGINIELISGSEIKLSCLIRMSQAGEALSAIRARFESQRASGK